MSRLAVVAIPLALLVFRPDSAQPQAAPVSNPQTTNARPTHPSDAITPRQAAETRADLLVAEKRYGEAIEVLGGLLSQEPKNAGLLNKIGIAYQAGGNSSRAQHYYKRAIRVDKTFASALNNLGTIEYERRNYRKAIRYYKRALNLRGDMAAVYGNLGYAFFAHKNYPEAVGAFEKALAIDPSIFERRGGSGPIVQQRGTTEPGMFYFIVAKSFAVAGDAERCAHFLKMARDEGYKNFLAAQKDPAFAPIIKDPRVQAVFETSGPLAETPRKPSEE